MRFLKHTIVTEILHWDITHLHNTHLRRQIEIIVWNYLSNLYHKCNLDILWNSLLTQDTSILTVQVWKRQQPSFYLLFGQLAHVATFPTCHQDASHSRTQGRCGRWTSSRIGLVVWCPTAGRCHSQRRQRMWSNPSCWTGHPLHSLTGLEYGAMKRKEKKPTT